MASRGRGLAYRVDCSELGQVQEVAASPKQPLLAAANQRGQLWLLHLPDMADAAAAGSSAAAPATAPKLLDEAEYEVWACWRAVAASAAHVVVRHEQGGIDGLAWHPNGRWLAYSFPSSNVTSVIKLCHVPTCRTFLATEPRFRDTSPCFDPTGRCGQCACASL